MRKIFIFLFLLIGIQCMYAQDPKIEGQVWELFDIQFHSPDKAIEIGKEILNNPKSDKIQISYALIGIGTSYNIKGSPQNAVSYLIKAVEEVKLTNNYEVQANANMGLANTYIKMGLVEQADKYLKEAINYTEKQPDPSLKNLSLSRLYQYIGENYKNQKNYELAIANLKKAIDYGRQYDDKRLHHEVREEFDLMYMRLGEIYFYAEKIDSSEWAFKRSLDPSLVIEQTKKHRKAYAYLYLGKIYSYRGENKRAIDTLSIAIKEGNNEGLYVKTELYSTLSNSYKAVNDFINYKKYNDLFLKFSQKLSIEEKEALEESIKQEQVMSDAKEKDKKLKIIALLMGLAVVVFVAFFSIYKIQKAKKREKLLFQNIISKLENRLEEKNKDLIDLPAVDSETIPVNSTEENIKKRIIPEMVEKDILQKLQKFENSEKFTNPKMSVTYLASQFGTNANYISEVVNDRKGKNFNVYINELRIDYICSKIINNPEYQNYKISYLAQESGFSSHSVFTKIFKNVTGISPSAFISQARGKAHQKT
ncbi:AraC family transcriptional regulator [Chryseobacterium sp. BLS98]|uniref:AraC family transcriptional regulator n=1 Tax=Chryseobacterium sp. BLS98 TaxID=885586 RepID=UPI000A04233C|nr:AraC family transcriptional regulator [Chryseobacterium sp. BLS98]